MAQKVERPVFRAKDFVHLHLHTDYSLLQSTIQLKPLAKRLKELDQKACAITDFGNMYGAVSYFNVMLGSGIQPIIGIEAHLTFGSRFDRTSTVGAGERGYYNIILLARNVEGYQNLIHLSSSAFTEGFHFKPRLDIELLSQRNKGLIGLSAGMDGAVGHFLLNGNEEMALSNAKLFEDIFGAGNYFLEIQDRVDERGQKLISDTVALSKRSGIDLVATNDVHYLKKDDARAQQVLIAIGEGRTVGESRGMESAVRYLRSADEMWDTFGVGIAGISH